MCSKNDSLGVSDLAIFVLVLLLFCSACTASPTDPHSWTEAEVATLRSLWIGSLKALPPDPSNRVADDPRAARLGYRFFFERRFSITGGISCASCHNPERVFTDNLALAQGLETMTRKTQTIVGTAYSPWQFWDGRKDSQWSQALAPLESAIEHGGSRTQYAHLIAEDEVYRTEYEALFGPLPDLSDRSRFPNTAGPVRDAAVHAAWERMTAEDRDAVSRVYANIGKAIAAYERLLLPGAAPFDAYVEALLAGDKEGMRAALTPDQVAGLRLFIGKADCTNCHNGPLFTNHEFHNTGVPPGEGLPLDQGRAEGVQELRADPFNCLGRFSDAEPDKCVDLRFVKPGGSELLAAFKVPTLRNVAETHPYMHAGQFGTLAEVVAHYNRAASSTIGHNELRPLNLTETEQAQLEVFLHSLSAPLEVAPELLEQPE
jgi:cytochrome c peroxidase